MKHWGKSAQLGTVNTTHAFCKVSGWLGSILQRGNSLYLVGDCIGCWCAVLVQIHHHVTSCVLGCLLRLPAY